MGILRALFGRKQSVPYETTIHVSIPLDDDTDLDDIDLDDVLADLQISAPPGVSIDHVQISARLHDDSDEDF